MLSRIYNYLHGYVVVPVTLACRDAGLFDRLAGDRFCGFQELCEQLRANAGHLRTALVLFESLGWIERRGDDYRICEGSRHREVPEDLRPAAAFPMGSYLRGAEGLTLTPWIERSSRGWDVHDAFLSDLFDGVVLTSLLVALVQHRSCCGRSSVRALTAPLADVGSPVPDRVQREIASLFFGQGWIGEDSVDAELTPQGSFVVERALLFSIAASYRPMLASIGQVLFGDCAAVFARDDAGHERHVDRTLNVIGSGHQHRKYFSDLEVVIVEIFDTEDLGAQPKYVADMGCGDGTLLKRVYDAIATRSRRGRHLDRHPVTLIGADFNLKSLEAAAATLAGYPHIVIQADVAQPDRFLSDLEARGIADARNIVHIRSFLDHDRPYENPRDRAAVEAHAVIPFETAFVARNGAEIPAAEAFQSLVEHMARWASTLDGHPLVVLEVHSMPPRVVRQNLSECENLHFDAYHRFSGQLQVSASHFLAAAAAAGLFPRAERIRRYPRTLTFSRITLTVFEKRAYRIRWARPGDLGALERLEAECWSAPLRAPPSILRSRLERYPQGQFVVESGDRVVGVVYSQRLDSEGRLNGSTVESVEDLHSSSGAVVQLLGVNIAPDSQHSRFGDLLLEFMLQYCELSNDVSAIIGVTRCKERAKCGDLSMSEYAALRDERGFSVDPILRFHQAHGAEIGAPLPGYRPRDDENEGYGVIVRYDVRERRRRDVQLDAGDGGAKSVAAIDRNTASAALRRFVARVLDRAEGEIDLERPLMELGVDSAGLMELGYHISKHFDVKVSSTFFFEYSSLARITDALAGGARSAPANANDTNRRPSSAAAPAPTTQPTETRSAKDGIAIVGVACRLPGGIRTPAEFWEVLRSGRSMVGTLADIRWRWPAALDPTDEIPAVQHVAHVGGVEEFDPAFFNVAPAEAELMDPQQRLLLELSWSCIEDAGYDATGLAGSRTGVFIGASGSDYRRLHEASGREVDPRLSLSTSMAAIPNRISFALDLCGPSVHVDTACSSSLVALHQAVAALQRGECRLALAGGVHVICDPANTLAYARAGMLSEDGRCRTFDARARGYVRGEGAVVFLLKPLQAALADRDHVYGTIIGSAVNHGGRAAGITAPNPRRQADLIVDAFRTANVGSEDVSYVEAHGTGTALGDPVEVQGLVSAFAAAATDRNRPGRSGIGSVKTNIGHLEAAAGAAGLLKVLLCLEHEELVANLHFGEINPKVSLDGSPLYVVHQATPWKRSAGQPPRVAGISSFGSGGTNAHVVVRERDHASTRRRASAADGRYVVFLSGRTDAALHRRSADLLGWLGRNPSADLGDLAATLALGRCHLECRAAFVVRDVQDLAAQLRGTLDGRGGSQSRVEWTGPARAALRQKLNTVFSDDLLSRAAQGDSSQGDALHALAELYVLGCDLDWGAKFGALLGERLSLPTYPFERERYWLSVNAEEGRTKGGDEATERVAPSEPVQRAPVNRSSWLFVEQRMSPRPLELRLDWRERLARYAGKSLYVVCDDREESERFVTLVARLYAGSPEPPALRRLDRSDLTEGSGVSLDPPPDVVFDLVSPNPPSSAGAVDLARAGAVFRLSQLLMKSCWDRPIQLYATILGGPRGVRPEDAALCGFVRSAMLENPRHRWKLVAFEGDALCSTPHQTVLQEWLADEVPEVAPATHVWPLACEVRHQGGVRETTEFVEVDRRGAGAGPRPRGTYLVAGGLGPVGEQMCHELARRSQATLVILARGALDSRRRASIAALEERGSAVHYVSADITDEPALRRAWEPVRGRVGPIHGVLHLARRVEDGPIFAKQWASFERAVGPKVVGSVLLDELTAAEPLDWFVLFSSIAAYGLRGSSDYAYAAAFQNEFARWREGRVAAGERRGVTRSLCWGPWSVDTYLANRPNENFSRLGWALMEGRSAFDAMLQAIDSAGASIGIVETNDPGAARATFNLEPLAQAGSGSRDWVALERELGHLERARDAGSLPERPHADRVAEVLAKFDVEAMPPSLLERAHGLLAAQAREVAQDRPPALEARSRSALRDVVRQTVTEVLKLPVACDERATFQNFGIDSISAMQLATRLEKRLAMPITPQWFLEFNTVSTLTEHLAMHASRQSRPANMTASAQP